MGLAGCYKFSDHMKYYAGLVIAYLTCDQRCAFSENTTESFVKLSCHAPQQKTIFLSLIQFLARLQLCNSSATRKIQESRQFAVCDILLILSQLMQFLQIALLDSFLHCFLGSATAIHPIIPNTSFICPLSNRVSKLTT